MSEDIDIIEDAEILEDPAAVADATEEFFARKAEEGADVSPIDAAVALSESAKAGSEAIVPAGSMAVGDCRFGVKATGEPLRKSHWLADSSVCGDLVMALPSSVLIAGRTAEAGGVAVDMGQFLDAIVSGAGRMEALAGVAHDAGLPQWAVSRLFGTFPVLYSVYSEAMDQCVLTVEAAAFKAAIGMNVTKRRRFKKEKTLLDREGKPVMDGKGNPIKAEENAEENYDVTLPPDATLSKAILTSRMKGRYKDEGRSNQAVIINISPVEAGV